MYLRTRLQYSEYFRLNTFCIWFSSARTIAWWTATTNVPIRITTGFNVEREDATIVAYTPTYIGFLLSRNSPSVVRLVSFFRVPGRKESPIFNRP